MSADAWQECPRCVAKGTMAYREARRRADEAYGKVSVAQWRVLDETAHSLKPELRDTLREDYEIGMYKGVFTIDYHASCTECDFTFSHVLKEPVDVG